MAKRRIQLEGPRARGRIIGASALRDLLEAVIEGSQRAVRLRTQGRSVARGPVPEWIEAATEFDVEVKEGSTVLEFSAPSLLEADPEQFGQAKLFPEVDPNLTSIDYLADSLEAAIAGEAGEERSDLYDRSLLQTLRSDLRPVFAAGVETIRLSGSPSHDQPVVIREEVVSTFRNLEKKIPASQHVRLAGKLDSIRHSDRTFTLIPASDREKIRGVVSRHLIALLQQLWGEDVLVLGVAHFTAQGKVQLLEADDLRPASTEDERMWGEMPEPFRGSELRPAAMSAPQGPRSGLNAVVGKWPGDEDDEAVADALRELS